MPLGDRRLPGHMHGYKVPADTVVALQRKVLWELQQKQVEEDLYLHFAFKHNTSGLLACSQLSQQASHSYTGPAKAWD